MRPKEYVSLSHGLGDHECIFHLVFTAFYSFLEGECRLLPSFLERF